MLEKRKPTRLKKYDYSKTGAYFVTICTYNRKRIFGDLCNGEMILNDIGKMVQRVWDEIPTYYDDVDVDCFQIMPNHVHGIIFIGDDKNIVGTPLVGVRSKNTSDKRAGTRPAPTMSHVVGVFKSVATNEYIRKVKDCGWQKFHKTIWQRSFYDHIIRSEDDLNRVREYIVNNPVKWEEDEYYI